MASSVARSLLLSFNSMESFEGCDGLAAGVSVVVVSFIVMVRMSISAGCARLL